MDQFVNIPTAEWRKIVNDISFMKEAIKALTHVVPATKEWISEKEAMDMLSIKDKRTMRKIATRNQINFFANGNKKVHYKQDELKKYIISHSTLQS